MSTAFDDVRLPEDIEAGALVGPSFQTGVVSLSGGAEQRNADWEQEILVADISYGIMAKEDPQDIQNSFLNVLRFFRARRGRHRHFRFRDLSDFECVNETLIAINDGKSFQFIKRYGAYKRIITRPDPGTIAVRVGNQSVPYTGNAAGPAWAISDLGLLTFVSAPEGPVTVDYEFDVPMRFDSDLMQVAIEFQNAGSIGRINLRQVREGLTVIIPTAPPAPVVMP